MNSENRSNIIVSQPVFVKGDQDVVDNYLRVAWLSGPSLVAISTDDGSEGETFYALQVLRSLADFVSSRGITVGILSAVFFCLEIG